VLAEALVRWQHAAGPFWPYVCAAPFLGTGESALLAAQVTRNGARTSARLSSAQRTLADRLLAAVGCDEDAPREVQSAGFVGEPSFPVVLADLPAEPLVAVAPFLAARGWYVVPVIQRWIASPAVLPCRALLIRLLRAAAQMRPPAAPRGALLIADGDRFGPAGYPLLATGRAFDNRYEYQICRFPSVRFLEAQGVRRVRWLTRPGLDARLPGPGGAGTEVRGLGLPPVARDLQPYREALLLAGIEVDVAAWGQDDRRSRPTRAVEAEAS